MNTPFFSIITPVFCGAEYIHSYLNSLYSQSFTSWESIVIDDGSLDNSLQKFHDCVDDTGRVKIYQRSLSKHFPGPYQSRNCGVSLASGEFLLFLDIDDIWSPDHLLNYYNKILSSPSCTLLYSPYYTFFFQAFVVHRL